MYNISLERCYSSASADVCCINIHAEMTEILQGKDWSFIFSVAHSFWQSVSRFLIKYSYYLTHKSHKMVDNKSKTPLIRHIQKKYITHEDLQYNTRATHSYNIVIFIRDIFFLYMSFGTFSYYSYVCLLEPVFLPASTYLYLYFQTCPGKCEENKECVQCTAFQTGPLDKTACEANCTHITVVEEVEGRVVGVTPNHRYMYIQIYISSKDSTPQKWFQFDSYCTSLQIHTSKAKSNTQFYCTKTSSI